MNPAIFSPPEGESTIDVSKRSQKTIKEILKIMIKIRYS